MVAHTCNPSYSGGRDQDDCDLRSVQEKLQDLTWKISKEKKDWGVIQVVELLPSKHEVLSSNPTLPKNCDFPARRGDTESQLLEEEIQEDQEFKANLGKVS
jgi:hypothetical protein